MAQVRSVLLVEDEAAFRRVIARNLSGRGLLVREVGTAAEAVTVMTPECPDLMLRLDEFHPMAYLPKPFPLEALLRLVFRSPGNKTRRSSENENP